MKIVDPHGISTWPAGARTDRPSVAIVHDSPHARLVLFRFRPRQAVPPHSIASSVVLTVLVGRGTFTGLGVQRELRAGQTVAYAPHELHAMRAEDEGLTILATITPSPASL